MEQLAKNEVLIAKVYRAMNNWVRVKIDNALPNQENLDEMVVQSKSAYDAVDYNPLRCWNDTDTE